MVMFNVTQFTPEVEQIVPPPPPPPPAPTDCDELGRVTRCYVSAYQRDRVHQASLIRGEFRCLVADFNGAVSKGRKIVSTTWRCWNTSSVIMSNARIQTSQKSSAIDILAQYGCMSQIKCSVTFDNGEVYNQVFRVIIGDAPWFSDEQQGQTGPSTLTSSYP